MLNAHAMFLIVHIFMNVSKLCLNRHRDCGLEPTSPPTLRDAFHKTLRDALHKTLRDAFHKTLRDAFHKTLRDAFHKTLRDAFHKALRDAFHKALVDACWVVTKHFRVLTGSTFLRHPAIFPDISQS